jgi:hypothetical protein
MKPSVYIETTVVSYLTARPSRDVVQLGHQLISREWWERCRNSFDLYVSDFVIDEARGGDPVAAAERLAMLAHIPLAPVTEPAIELADRIAVSLSLPRRARLDAAHVAIAAVHGITFLLTWNCRHLANGALAAKIEAACAVAGYTAPRILTPDLLMEPP